MNIECDECGNETSSDDHKAICLEDWTAAKRLEDRESQWDRYGVSGYEL